MRTPSKLYRTTPNVYGCELNQCPQCEQALVETSYVSGLKTVQMMSEVSTIAYRPKVCSTSGCSQGIWPSASWQRIAPKYSIYGYDVIAQIGWERQKGRMNFGRIFTGIKERIQISESQVRYLYHEQYLPLLASHERQHLSELEALGKQKGGLLLGLDGLMPEGGEPQLWVVRELQTGWTLRSGWMTSQDEAAFVAFLQPIADLNIPFKALMSDKQRRLLPAVKIVFPQSLHGFCQFHYLDNAAEPVAATDEQMKIELRQGVRAEVGGLIRLKQADTPIIPVVTGLIPSPVPLAPDPAAPLAAEEAAKRERERIVQDLLARVRYLLTLKARPPFRLAGIEMFARLQEMVVCLQALLAHQPEPRLVTLLAGLQKALATTQSAYLELCQAAAWLADLANVLDPDGKPKRSGEQVQAEWLTCLTVMETQGQLSPRLQAFSTHIAKVSRSYASGLFHSYDIPDFPRTNNDRESEFRRLRQRLLSTTGQVGATKRLLLREGAWELIPGPASLLETIAAISHVQYDQFLEERLRVRLHRAPFRLHTRSARSSESQLNRLLLRWTALPPTTGSQ